MTLPYTTRPHSPDHNGASHNTKISHPTAFARIITASVPPARTPASTISNPSSRNSPLIFPSHMMDTTTSLQPTPDGPVPSTLPPSSLPTSFNLPEPMWPSPATANPVASPSAMSDVISTSKGPGLIRRISRSARFPRRRGSTANSQRDNSVGPTIMRRRSDSRGMGDNVDISDLELEFYEDDVEDVPESVYGSYAAGLGITASGPSMQSIPEGTAPVQSSKLQTGSILTKVSKKRSMTCKFRLDQKSAKVSWDIYGKARSFYIDDIKEIRTAEQARSYREECGVEASAENRWFTVTYSCDDDRSKGRKTKFLHLIAPDDSTFALWTQTLEVVSRQRIELMAGLAGSAEKSAKTLWRIHMDQKFNNVTHTEADETLDYPTILDICRRLHINSTENAIRDHFEKADVDHTGSLNQSQFLMFVRRLKDRKDLKCVYNNIKKETEEEVDRASFMTFLKDVQRVDVDAELEHWNALFDKLSRISKAKPQHGDTDQEAQPTMTFSAFSSFITSPANAVLRSPPADAILDRPLNEYFISSSHNTYLLGRQVRGESSSEAYITALQKGCRCIEIDCWNGQNGQPIVSHGRTMTIPASFHECIKVVNKYAFVSSQYPLIISLEVHCNDQQQEVMTDIMKKEFGDALLQHPIDDRAILPSPEQLKGKILIKVKAACDNQARSHPVTTEPTLITSAPLPGRRQRSVSSPWQRPTLLDNSTIPPSPLVSSPPSMSPNDRPSPFWPSSPRTSATSAGTVPNLGSSADDSDSPPSIGADEKAKKKTSKITSVLGALGVYTQGVSFKKWSQPETQTYNHIYSMNEYAFNKQAKPGSDTKPLLDAHNFRHLMRVYPGQHRVGSSNFDPLRTWRRGVQMAALNWQTYDLGRQINDAMFAAGSDRSGYVLKPAELRYEDHELTEGLLAPKLKPKKQVKFAVNIISAQQLPRPANLSNDTNINPYVEFEMFCAEDKRRGIASGEGGLDASAPDGMSGIGSPLRKRTLPVGNNGYDPNWNETITMTLETRYPSLVFVRWSVWNSPDGANPTNSGGPLATFTAKLSTLQQGYRHLPLYNANGEQYLFSSLFCKIDKADHVAIDESTGGHSDSNQPSPIVESKSSRRDFFRRAFSRSNSQKKKDQQQRTRTDFDVMPIARSTTSTTSTRNDTDSSISRSSTFERLHTT